MWDHVGEVNSSADGEGVAGGVGLVMQSHSVAAHGQVRKLLRGSIEQRWSYLTKEQARKLHELVGELLRCLCLRFERTNIEQHVGDHTPINSSLTGHQSYTKIRLLK